MWGTFTIEDYFPGLRGQDYEVTSEPDRDYNCIAWALGENDRNWNPFGLVGDYWPKGISCDDRVSTIVSLFIKQGFEVCQEARLEDQFAKVAIFGDEGLFTHVALQLPDGRWTSKLGKKWDIKHDLDDLTRIRSSFSDCRYGEIALFMRRQGNRG